MRPCRHTTDRSIRSDVTLNRVFFLHSDAIYGIVVSYSGSISYGKVFKAMKKDIKLMSNKIFMKRVGKNVDRSDETVELVYNAIIDEIHECIREGYTVRIQNFCTVGPVIRKGRKVPDRRGGMYEIGDYETVAVRLSPSLKNEVK